MLNNDNDGVFIGEFVQGLYTSRLQVWQVRNQACCSQPQPDEVEHVEFSLILNIFRSCKYLVLLVRCPVWRSCARVTCLQQPYASCCVSQITISSNCMYTCASRSSRMILVAGAGPKWAWHVCRRRQCAGQPLWSRAPSACTKPRGCLLYTSPSPRDATLSRMPSSA